MAPRLQLVKRSIWIIYTVSLVVFLSTGRRRLGELSETDEILRLLTMESWKLSYSYSDFLPYSDEEFASKLYSVQNPGPGLLWPFNDSNEVKAYLIHVGKAGGSSLQQRLNIRDAVYLLPCRMNRTMESDEDTCFKKKKSTRLKRRIFASFHMFSSRYSRQQKQWLRNNTNLLIFTIRDPINRVISAFNFHRHNYLNGRDPRPISPHGPRKLGYQIYFECFPTVEDLALAVAANEKDKNQSTFCQQLGRQLIEGKVEPTVCPHLYWNYRYYVDRNWRNRTKHVAVVRTESLWDDVARLEFLLGGDPTKFMEPDKQVKYTHGSERFQLTSGVSEKGALSLCCVLRAELQVYHDLVRAAANLDNSEKVSTLQALLGHCGIGQLLDDDEVIGWEWNNWFCEAEENIL